MTRKGFNILLILVIILATPSLGQIADADEEIYTKEFSGGFNLNTNGGVLGGLVGRYARRIDDYNYWFYGLEIVEVKHPKEQRYASLATGSPFVYGKSLNLFSIRPQFGKMWVLFQKYPEEGVRWSFITAGGPTLGLLKPYFIEYEFQSTNIAIEQYDPAVHTNINDINGSAGFFTGFGDMSAVLGLNFKAAMAFEFGRYDDRIAGVEAGLMLETFTRKIEIVPIAPNPQVYSSAFITIYYGFRN